MDVIALRKNSGTVSGDIRINGYPQEKKSFRRCSGYVEQFDIQTPQLTIRETVLFSARLRLDATKVKTGEEKENFCDAVIETLELTPLAHCLVGSDEEGGLSFEQKKRLSIAVELAASPSILFLDEVRIFGQHHTSLPRFFKKRQFYILPSLISCFYSCNSQQPDLMPGALH